MKIKDMIVLLPVSIITTALKFARFYLNSEDKKFIAENHLYHCVSSKEVADNIIKSGYLRPATGALKTLNSYGRASVCLFGGIPNTDNFMKNLNVNLYTEPDKIINAVEICIHEDELNKNYKSRKISDEAILYEGYCFLPQDRTRSVQLVMDLKRDENADVKIERLSRGKTYLEKKNPYDDPKFALAVITFGYEGIVQSNLEETLQEFANSENGKYLRDKFEQFDNNTIHGKKMLMHAERTTLLANIIAEKEGSFIGDDADRKRDILAYA